MSTKAIVFTKKIATNHHLCPSRADFQSAQPFQGNVHIANKASNQLF